MAVKDLRAVLGKTEARVQKVIKVQQVTPEQRAHKVRKDLKGAMVFRVLLEIQEVKVRKAILARRVKMVHRAKSALKAL